MKGVAAGGGGGRGSCASGPTRLLQPRVAVDSVDAWRWTPHAEATLGVSDVAVETLESERRFGLSGLRRGNLSGLSAAGSLIKGMSWLIASFVTVACIGCLRSSESSCANLQAAPCLHPRLLRRK